MQIGFIGLGNMGFPMARRLLQESHDVIAFDTRSEALERAVALGAQAAASVKEVADRAETVLAAYSQTLRPIPSIRKSKKFCLRSRRITSRTFKRSWRASERATFTPQPMIRHTE